MGQVTARKRGKTWEYGFEGARISYLPKLVWQITWITGLITTVR